MIRWLASKLAFWRSDKPTVAVVRLQGVISPASGGVRRNLNLETIEPQLKKAFSMSSVEAVALVINSPGGSPVQSQLIADRVRQLAEKKQVPVMAFCEDAAASGGYWLACAADEIYVSPASIIGSIGVVSAGFGFPEALAKLGIERRVYTAGTSKAMLDPFKPENKADIEHLKALQQALHGEFISYVKSRRGARLIEDDEFLFSGAFWSGTQAKDYGLVDHIGTLNQVMSQKFGDDVHLMTIASKRKFGGLGALASQARLFQEVGSVSLGRDFIESGEEKLWWSRLGL